MNLDQFKSALDTDARIEVEKCKKEIARLKSGIRDRDNRIEMMSENIKQINHEYDELKRKIAQEKKMGLDMSNPNLLSTLMMLGEMIK